MLLKNIKFCNKFIHYLQSFSFLNKLIMLALQKRHLLKKIKYFFSQTHNWVNQHSTRTGANWSFEKTFSERKFCLTLKMRQFSITDALLICVQQASEREMPTSRVCSREVTRLFLCHYQLFLRYHLSPVWPDLPKCCQSIKIEIAFDIFLSIWHNFLPTIAIFNATVQSFTKW